jgi:glyoxylase-like metal-dependent hydrolase (beta-lactamase superfamily II)
VVARFYWISITQNRTCQTMRDAGTMVMNGCLTARLPNPRVVAGQDMSRPNSAYLVETNPSTHLKWSTFVTPSIPVVTTDFAPGEHERPWPPTSSTLIYGLRDAVLVDSFITLEQARAQADWIASTGKNLTTIYATHGHGDHFFRRAFFWSASQKRALLPRPVRLKQ